MKIKPNTFEGGDEELVNILRWEFTIKMFDDLGYYKDNQTMNKYKDVLVRFGCYFDGFTNKQLTSHIKRCILDFVHRTGCLLY